MGRHTGTQARARQESSTSLRDVSNDYAGRAFVGRATLYNAATSQGVQKQIVSGMFKIGPAGRFISQTGRPSCIISIKILRAISNVHTRQHRPSKYTEPRASLGTYGQARGFRRPGRLWPHLSPCLRRPDRLWRHLSSMPSEAWSAVTSLILNVFAEFRPNLATVKAWHLEWHW